MRHMKIKNGIITGLLAAGFVLISCERNNTSVDTPALKQSISQNAAELNSAIENISSTNAFKVFTVNESYAKSAEGDSAYKVYIGLDQIKGVYEYSPVTNTNRWGSPLIRFFSKTSDNNNMIVNLPLKKVEHPMLLRNIEVSDTSFVNNFKISVSAYHNNYNNFRDYDYLLSSEISIDNISAGNLNIVSAVSPEKGTNYKSEYHFSDGYKAVYSYLSGDTTFSGFGILKDDNVLYEENRQTVRNDTARFGRERLYTLTIGDVKIVRKSGVVAPAIYVGGVLQTSAVVEIIDNVADPEASVCNKRDIKITFDDGTTTTISTLIGESVENIRVLFDSLHNVYFAAYIVDWIAYDIYYDR